MRYRLEVLEYNQMVVHNVETGLILGNVRNYRVPHPYDPDQTCSVCAVDDHEGLEIAIISTVTVPNPLSKASEVIAGYEERDTNLGGFRAQATERCCPDRVEYQLGTVLADIIALIGGIIEDKGCTSGTLEDYTYFLVELHGIWYASQFGSYDTDVRRTVPYFSDPTSSNQRLSFAAAAQVYGMKELRQRMPDITDAALRELLSWPLEQLSSLLERLKPSTTSVN